MNLKPQEPGKHQLSIQYGGVHVQGSPYTVRVSGAPDPTRVRVYGPGVEHGVLAMYQSRFICDTRGAGAGQLTVRIRGPKGKKICIRLKLQVPVTRTMTVYYTQIKIDRGKPGQHKDFFPRNGF